MPRSADADAEGRGRMIRRMMRWLGGKGTVGDPAGDSGSPSGRTNVRALADQLLVSGTNFTTTVVLGRLASEAELGVYALGFTILHLGMGVQDSLVTGPYTVRVQGMEGRPRARYAGSAVLHLFGLAGLCVVGLATVGAVSLPGLEERLSAPVVWLLAATVPFVLLRQFARRMAFAHLRFGTALRMDALVAAVQVGGLLLLALAGGLDAAGAFVVTALACGVAAALWLKAALPRMRLDRAAAPKDFTRNWDLGGWLFGSNVVSMAQTYSIYWLLAWMMGPDATGVMAALLSIIYFSNPVLIGIRNVLLPTAARTSAVGGDVRGVVFGAARLLGLAMVAFLVAVALFGDPAVEILYGPSYAGHAATLTVLAVGALVGAVTSTADHGLWALERPDINFKALLVGLAATLAVALGLLSELGLLGGAVAILSGQVVSGAVQSWAFLRLTAGRTAAVGRTA